MELESITLSEITQTQTNAICYLLQVDLAFGVYIHIYFVV